MHIMTKYGWKAIDTPKLIPAIVIPTMLQNMGITPEYDGVAAMANYMNGPGRGVYNHYNEDGTWHQIAEPINPL